MKTNNLTPEQYAAKNAYERAERAYAEACKTENKAKIASAYEKLLRAQSTWFSEREARY